jgi:hypothetical protein
MEKPSAPRCGNCRAEITVPDSYAQGDQIKCSTCGSPHRVVRGDVLRLVLLDVEPLKGALREAQDRLARLEDEMRGARANLGIGVNGLGLGLIFVLVKIVWEEQLLSTELILKAAAIALGSGVLLELMNFFFLAKRRRIVHLTAEIAAGKGEVAQLRQRLREATRVR